MNIKAETIFLMPSARFTYLSSSMVKQIAGLGGDVSQFVPQHVSERLMKKLKSS
jgi:pantetheine-phosphate adenylyltransferase